MNGKDPQSTITATSSDYYFDSYSHFGIHEEMLKDEVQVFLKMTICYMFITTSYNYIYNDHIIL